jgi:hypothetical protein
VRTHVFGGHLVLVDVGAGPRGVGGLGAGGRILAASLVEDFPGEIGTLCTLDAVNVTTGDASTAAEAVIVVDPDFIRVTIPVQGSSGCHILWTSGESL